ncbi:hypothetical protein JB92DRAFT_3128830 [Gautieria morchelliformis]|nr:hypothetical protein JB92DRAFT_3128830 [Gautieria morchelliformis]
MHGTVTSVFERILSTSIAPTDDLLQTPITLSLKELLAISPAISDCFLRSFQGDKGPESIVRSPPTPCPALPVISQPPSNSVPSLSVLSHRDIPVHRVVRKDPQLRSSQSYGVAQTSSCAASSAPSHARVAPCADVSHTFPPTVPCTATTRRTVGIGAAHGNSATLKTIVQTCDVARQPRTDTHLHAWVRFPLYPTPPLPSSRAQYMPMHFSRRHRLPSHWVPSSPPLSPSPTPSKQNAPTQTPLAATTCVPTHNVTQRHRRTEMQQMARSSFAGEGAPSEPFAVGTENSLKAKVTKMKHEN